MRETERGTGRLGERGREGEGREGEGREGSCRIRVCVRACV